jgi:hypothetical protein
MHPKLQVIYDQAKTLSAETNEEFETVFARLVVIKCVGLTYTFVNQVSKPGMDTLPLNSPGQTIEWYMQEYTGTL